MNELPLAVVFEDSAKNFPNGGAFVANFHNKDIRFLTGNQVFSIIFSDTPKAMHRRPITSGTIPSARDWLHKPPIGRSWALSLPFP